MDEFEKLLLEYQSGTLHSNSGNFTLFEALISKYRSMTCKCLSMKGYVDWCSECGYRGMYDTMKYCPECGRKVNNG